VGERLAEEESTDAKEEESMTEATSRRPRRARVPTVSSRDLVGGARAQVLPRASPIKDLRKTSKQGRIVDHEGAALDSGGTGELPST